MHLPDDSPGAINIFVHWLYRNNIALGGCLSYTYDLYDLYIFAEKICHEELKNKIMDAICETAQRNDLTDMLITPEIIKKVWGGLDDYLPDRNRGLQLFSVNLTAWTFHERCENNISSKSARLMHESDFRMLSDIGKNFFSFEFRCHRAFQYYIHLPKGNVTKADPRTADLRESTGPCFYHCHENPDACHLKKTGVRRRKLHHGMKNRKIFIDKTIGDAKLLALNRCLKRFLVLASFFRKGQLSLRLHLLERKERNNMR